MDGVLVFDGIRSRWVCPGLGTLVRNLDVAGIWLRKVVSGFLVRLSAVLFRTLLRCIACVGWFLDDTQMSCRVRNEPNLSVQSAS